MLIQIKKIDLRSVYDADDDARDDYDNDDAHGEGSQSCHEVLLIT